MQDDDQRRIEQCAVNRIWPVRDELKPSGRHTWRVWFEKKFGRPLAEAHEEFGGRRRRLHEREGI